MPWGFPHTRLQGVKCLLDPHGPGPPTPLLTVTGPRYRFGTLQKVKVQNDIETKTGTETKRLISWS